MTAAVNGEVVLGCNLPDSCRLLAPQIPMKSFLKPKAQIAQLEYYVLFLKTWVSKPTQVRELAVKPGDLSSIFDTHVEAESQPLPAGLYLQHTHYGTTVTTITDIHINE